MKNLKFIFLTFLLIFIIFCTRPPKESIYGTYDPKTLFWLPDNYDLEEERIFNDSFDEVWTVLINILKEVEMPIASSDKASGIIALGEWVTTDTLIETRYCDCGRYSFKIHTYRGWERRPEGQIHDPRIAHTTFYVTPIDSLHTEMKIVNKFQISYRSASNLLEKPAKDWFTGLVESTYPAVWECTSTGRLESWLFQTMETKLSSQKSVSPKDH